MKEQMIKRGLERIFIALTLFIALIPLTAAVDPYKPYLHNPIVPEHPDILLQGTFETALWPGEATYTYPIEVSPGTNDLKPVLSFSYNHHATTQRPSIVGTAWSLTGNYIMRDVDYSFANTSDDKFRLVLDGQLHDLSYASSDTRYHTEIESFLNIQNVSGGNNTNGMYWLVKKKDGTTYRFGYNSDSELVSNILSYTVKWSLDLITDTHNNNIYYSYNESPYVNDTGAVYPAKIEYNNDKKRVIEFILEGSDRPDKWLVYEQGNKIRESRRIKEVQIKAEGNLARRYILNYTILDTDARSFLSSITLFGNDGTSSLPSVSFEYFNVTKGWLEDPTFALPSSVLGFGQASTDYGVRLTDFNRDGLMDITKADEFNPQDNQSWINNGSGWYRNDSWNIPENIVGRGPFSLGEKGVRFLDVNGDGFIDIVRGDGSLRKSYLNTKTGWSNDNSSWHLPTNANPVTTSSDIYERGVQFVDFNGDGLVDILSATDDWNRAWIHNGNGWTLDTSWNVPSTARFIIYPSGEDEGVRIEDINGDGLPDLVKGKGTSRTTWLNNGTNWIEDGSWKIPANAVFVNGSGSELGVRFADVNGDGLVDILKGDRGNETSWINTGETWTQDNAWNVPESSNFVYDVGFNVGVKMIDVNGNGLVDVMLSNHAEPSRTQINKAAKAYLLKKITNNIGGSNTMDYIKSTSLNNAGDDEHSDLGFNLWIVNNVVEDNNITGVQRITSAAHYGYRNGFFDYKEKEFRGFGLVDEIKPNISITRHHFHQDNALKGKEFKTEFLDEDSVPYQINEFNWSIESQNNYYVVELSKEAEQLYDGSYDTPKTTEMEYSYDDFGNVIGIIYKGNNSTQNDERHEYWNYVYNTTAWIVDKPKRYKLLDFDNSTRVRETLFRYDGLSYEATPTKGDLTWEEQWLNTDNTNATRQYSYDSHGNLIKETDPNGFNTTYDYGTIDTTFTFADEIINAKGHKSKFTYELGTGNLLSEKDSNGYITNYTYDVFGRIKKEIQPYDSETYSTKEYNYTFDGNAPELIKVKQREDNGTSNTLDSYYYYDGLGNLIQIKTEANSTNQIITDFYYDSEKRIVKQSNPYFASANEGYTTPQSISSTIYTYDPLSRVILLTNPDNTTQNITFDHWQITINNENDNKKIYNLDAYDQISEVVEYIGDNYFITKYAYNPAGDLIQINDSYGNNVFMHSYDSLGRKIRQTNADLGTWQYFYDKIGNLIKQTDNRRLNVSLEYDELNRLIKKNNSDEIITYAYDRINGTLWKTITEDLTIENSYDKKLRKVSETRTIDGKTFTKSWTYDSLDRTKKETLPDGAVISYNYTVSNQISSISDILNNAEYDELQKPKKLVYENNLNTNFTYNKDMFRVERIVTENKQDISYRYDNVGNIISINDSANNMMETISYDKLDRLLSSQRKNSTNIDFIFNYSYDALGSLLKIFGVEENVSYYYGSNPLHTPLIITSTMIVIPNDTQKFIIQNSSGTRVAWLGSKGNIFLKGSCNNQTICIAPNNSFKIKNASGDVVAYIDSTTGDMCIESTTSCQNSDEQTNCNSPNPSFIIQNSTGSEVIVIDRTNGNLCSTGRIYENQNEIP